MKKVAIAAVLALSPQVLWAWPWSTDMMNQPSIKGEEPVPGMKGMYPFPARSIPVQGIPTPVADREQAKSLANPIPATPESIKKGRTLFKIICAACHGQTGKAESPVASKIGAISLVEDYVQKDLTEGWIFGTITYGSAIMPAYGAPSGNYQKRGSNDLTVEERWHVVNYVRHGLTQEPATKTAAK